MNALLIVGLALQVQAAQPIRLADDLGSHEHRISSTVPGVQDYFNQGMRLAYAFNHDAAIRSFREAIRRDPKCAICWWGVAYSYGPNINLPMDSAAGVAAYAAMQQALKLQENATEKERAYIRALATRYGPDPLKDRARLDSAYARAMMNLARAYPDDPDAATLAAEALMDLRPWMYWTQDGRPEPGTTEIVSLLENAIRRDPNNPGACHFYIHAVEAAQPEKAVACAERLASLMPGAGHLVHMPAHIYIRVGRWNDAIEANRHAVHADEQHVTMDRPSGFYLVGYYPHNHHFLAFAATMAGQSSVAIESARNVRKTTPLDEADEYMLLQPLLAYPHLALATFGRWKEVLTEPLPPDSLRLAKALTSYARGVAYAATGMDAAARMMLDTVKAIARTISDQPFKNVVDIATYALAGEIDARIENDLKGAEQNFRAAMRIEDSMSYMEPPDWHYPIRHSLGAILLRANKPAEAEKVYREDLQRFPENGWSLAGLAASLRAQDRTAEADQVEQRLRTAWARADVKPVASRL